jgi:hypothetical protein
MANSLPPNPFPYLPYTCSGNVGQGSVCRQDTPYPSVSQESVPSQIDNLVNALYGSITKTVQNGRVIWNIPCDPTSAPATVFNIPRNTGEGLLCYFIRAFNQANSGQITFYGKFNGTFTGKILDSVTSYGTAGQILQSTGTGLLWVNKDQQLIAGALADGSAGQIPYQIAPDTTGFVPAGNSGQVLKSNGTGSPSWINQALINSNAITVNGANVPTSATIVGTNSSNQIIDASSATLANNTTGNASTATTATNLASGLAGQVPYQTAAGATSFTATGATNQLLQSNLSGAPTWTATPSLTSLNVTGNVSAGSITGGAATQINTTSIVNALIFG